ncbi:MAG: hypothetical protein WA459_13635 [Stellaceae bacterium]
MRRRALIASLTASAVAWPLALRAQQKPMPAVGWLGMTSPGPYAQFVAAFRRGLSDTGYVEGQNVAIEYRWPRATMIGSPHWPPISSAARSM